MYAPHPIVDVPTSLKNWFTYLNNWCTYLTQQSIYRLSSWCRLLTQQFVYVPRSITDVPTSLNKWGTFTLPNKWSTYFRPLQVDQLLHSTCNRCIYLTQKYNSGKGQTWAACNKLNYIWQSDIAKSTKIKLLRACGESILLYGAETWTISKELEKHLDGTYRQTIHAGSESLQEEPPNCSNWIPLVLCNNHVTTVY